MDKDPGAPAGSSTARIAVETWERADGAYQPLTISQDETKPAVRAPHQIPLRGRSDGTLPSVPGNGASTRATRSYPSLKVRRHRRCSCSSGRLPSSPPRVGAAGQPLPPPRLSASPSHRDRPLRRRTHPSRGGSSMARERALLSSTRPSTTPSRVRGRLAIWLGRPAVSAGWARTHSSCSCSDRRRTVAGRAPASRTRFSALARLWPSQKDERSERSPPSETPGHRRRARGWSAPLTPQAAAAAAGRRVDVVATPVRRPTTRRLFQPSSA